MSVRGHKLEASFSRGDPSYTFAVQEARVLGYSNSQYIQTLVRAVYLYRTQGETRLLEVLGIKGATGDGQKTDHVDQPTRRVEPVNVDLIDGLLEDM